MDHIECPHCAKFVETYAVWCRFCMRVLLAHLKMDCPVCDEPIMKTDFYCRFCNSKFRNEPYRSDELDDDEDDGFAGAPVKVPPDGPAPTLTTSVREVD